MTSPHSTFHSALLVGVLLFAPQALFAQCANPVTQGDVLAYIDLGFSVDHSNPQPPMARASSGEAVRGFIDLERSELVSPQCESDYFLTYFWLGVSGDTVEDRFARLANFRNRMTGFVYHVDGEAIAPERLLETPMRDGFHPVDGRPLAYIFIGWIAEPFEIGRGPHEGSVDIFFDGFPNDPTTLTSSFEIVSGDFDLDGIENSIDGTFDGAFNDQADEFSDNFTDQQLGGATRGSIFLRGDNVVTVHDTPLGGVQIAASGGAGVSLVSLCGPSNADAFNLFLTDGNQVVVSCGSLTSEVLSGPVTVAVGVNIQITLPAGAKAFMENLPGSMLSITNLSGPGGPGILVEDENGVTEVGPDDPPLITMVDVLPDAPSDVSGRAKRSKANLTWTAVAADSYDVFRSLQGGGPYEFVGSTERNVFVDSGVTGGETYFYVVQAVNENGNSGHSNEVEVPVTSGRRR